ncbi:hypothetical protein D3C78_1920790 [compost metagenome]
MTVAPFATGLASVSTTLLPATDTAETLTGLPFTLTTKLPGPGGLAASSASL